MRRFITTSGAVLLAATLPLQAQEEDGFSLMERGAQLFFEGIQREMEPALNDLMALADDMEPALRAFISEMGPAFVELLGQIEDLSAYHPPEILPNGDIILRKKTPEEMAEENPEGEIEI
ncbi:hypothetical protein EI983_05735 [Roseovarius faecimaris]|uniref:AAA+ family ATPase n=1 Tax=Roseovarius faecimaris TaxID=2494550 RepID=A0A6I6IPQ8_9RHOB|nr:hypothetical protein [Roseovarius faecimaris]QGX97803.1 hypothetical protein EI983_05735 [Roseovarius faecimaris]